MKLQEVNEALTDDPSLVNSAAFTEGWLFKVKLSATDELEQLLPASKYTKEIN